MKPRAGACIWTVAMLLGGCAATPLVHQVKVEVTTPPGIEVSVKSLHYGGHPGPAPFFGTRGPPLEPEEGKPIEYPQGIVAVAGVPWHGIDCPSRCRALLVEGSEVQIQFRVVRGVPKDLEADWRTVVDGNSIPEACVRADLLRVNTCLVRVAGRTVVELVVSVAGSTVLRARPPGMTPTIEVAPDDYGFNARDER